MGFVGRNGGCEGQGGGSVLDVLYGACRVFFECGGLADGECGCDEVFEDSGVEERRVFWRCVNVWYSSTRWGGVALVCGRWKEMETIPGWVLIYAFWRWSRRIAMLDF